MTALQEEDLLKLSSEDLIDITGRLRDGLQTAMEAVQSRAAAKRPGR